MNRMNLEDYVMVGNTAVHRLVDLPICTDETIRMDFRRIKYMALENKTKAAFQYLNFTRTITSQPQDSALASHVDLSDKAPRTESGYKCHER